MTEPYFDSKEAKQKKSVITELLFDAHCKLEDICMEIAKDYINDPQFYHRIVRISKLMEEIEKNAHESRFI